MIIITFLETFVSGGRIQLVYVPLHFLIVFFYDRGKLYISRRTRRRIFLGIAVTFIVVNAITSSRGSNWEKETIGLYVSGGIPLMDHYVSSFNSEYTFGAAALSGYLRTIFSLLENVGFVYPRFLTRIQQLLDVEEVVYIGSLQMNAFVTLFYYFFIDGGLWGVAIETGIYGALSKACYIKANQKSNKMLLTYCLIVQGIVFSMVRFQFVNIPYCLSFILLQFLFEKKRGERK